MQKEEMEKGLFRNEDGYRVRLGKSATSEVINAWAAWREYVFNQYIPGRNTRALYNEHNRRGKHLVDVQTKHGVWLIHPDNATAGLKADDPRIIETEQTSC